MFQNVFEWLKGVTIFVIVCETALNFAPSGNYKRYLKPFAGLLILLRITAFLFAENNFHLRFDIEDLFSEYEITMGKIVNDDKLKEDLIKQIDENGGSMGISDIGTVSIGKISIAPIEIMCGITGQDTEEPGMDADEAD